MPQIKFGIQPKKYHKPIESIYDLDENIVYKCNIPFYDDYRFIKINNVLFLYDINNKIIMQCLWDVDHIKSLFVTDDSLTLTWGKE